MSLRIQNPGQPEVDTLSNSASAKTANAQSGSSAVASTYSHIGALDDTQDTASVSAAHGQLSGDLPIRQDRVDSLRAQIETGAYTVNAHAVATAMFQNLFRSSRLSGETFPMNVQVA
jgi:flagellar biosynthesis anti-sigma factor FlgM